MKVQSSRDKKDPEVLHQLGDTAERATNLRQEARSQLGGRKVIPLQVAPLPFSASGSSTLKERGRLWNVDHCCPFWYHQQRSKAQRHHSDQKDILVAKLRKKQLLGQVQVHRLLLRTAILVSSPIP